MVGGSGQDGQAEPHCPAEGELSDASQIDLTELAPRELVAEHYMRLCDRRATHSRSYIHH